MKRKTTFIFIWSPQLKPGDLAIIPSQNDKHIARDTFLVTDDQETNIQMHKIIHSHNSELTNVRYRSYIKDKKSIFLIKNHPYNIQPPNTKTQSKTV